MDSFIVFLLDFLIIASAVLFMAFAIGVIVVIYLAIKYFNL